MKPVHFKEANVVFAADQPEYQPLPAFVGGDANRTVVTCWKLSPEELAEVQRTGMIWLMQMTFGQPLQPQLPLVEKPLKSEPVEEEKEEEKEVKEEEGKG